MLTFTAHRSQFAFYLIVAVGMMSHQAAAQFFHSPYERLGAAPQEFDPALIYSNLGERRPTDGPAWTNHGATDFVTGNSRQNVYSPDTGKVRFYGAQVQGHLARNAGLAPVKIGRFSMLHFGNAAQLFVDPRQLRQRRGLPAQADNWWVYVIEPDEPFLRRVGGRQKTLKNKRVRGGVRQNAAGQWENVFFYNRKHPIAETHGPDLHVLYYETKASDYGDRADIRNALSVFNYKNENPPVIHNLWLFSQNLIQGQQSKKLIAGNAPNPAPEVIDIAQDGGVDVVVTASAFQKGNGVNRAGIYQLAYQVDRILGAEEEHPKETIQGPGGRTMVPSIPQLPPAPPVASKMVFGAPPVSDTIFSPSYVKNPSH